MYLCMVLLNLEQPIGYILTKTDVMKRNLLFLLTFIVSSMTVWADDSGTCGASGDNLTWTFVSSTGALTISGTGEMANYSYNNAPWMEYGILSVKINSGVTSIGNYAFALCENLTSITIPNSVTSIGDGAFEDCSNLASVTIGNSVTSIGDDAFRCCYPLASITIPNSVTSIGQNAFHITQWLNNLPDGMVYAGKVAYTYKGAMPENTEIILNLDTKGIAGGTFKNQSNLKSIIISSNVTNIGFDAFSECTGLTSVYVMATTPPTLDETAFNDNASGRKIYVPSSRVSSYQTSWAAYAADITAINASGNCGDNVTWNFDGNQLTFSGTGAMTDFTNGSAPWYVFRDYITAVEIGSGVTSMGCHALDDYSNLTTISVDNANAHLSTVDGVLFNKYKTSLVAYPAGKKATVYAIPNTVTTICDAAFYGCAKLNTLTIGSGVTSIGKDTFKGCTKVGNVYCYANPAKLTWDEDGDDFKENGNTLCHVIDASEWTSFSGVHVNFQGDLLTAHGNCGAECTYDFYKDGRLVIGGKGAMTDYENYSDVPWASYKQYITAVEIANGVTNIGNYAFYGCNELKSVDIPSSVTRIGNQAFAAYNLVTVTCWATSVPNFETDAFPHAGGNLCIYVPSVKNYKDANGWSSYWNADELYNHLYAIPAGTTMTSTTNSIPTGTFAGNWTTYYYSGANMQAPEGVTVYKAAVNGSNLTLTAIADRIITARQAVVMKSEATPIALTTVASGSSDDYSGNMLAGVDQNTDCAPNTNYTLANKNGFGFYKYLGTTLYANKAYLPGSAVTGAPEYLFSIDEETTAMEDVRGKMSDVNDGVVYDLQGRKVQQPVRGIYVRNGRKIVVK